MSQPVIWDVSGLAADADFEDSYSFSYLIFRFSDGKSTIWNLSSVIDILSYRLVLGNTSCNDKEMLKVNVLVCSGQIPLCIIKYQMPPVILIKYCLIHEKLNKILNFLHFIIFYLLKFKIVQA